MILTDDEIWTNGSRIELSEAGIIRFGRSIEAAILEKIGEPVGYMCCGVFYGADDVDPFCEASHLMLYKLPEVTK